MRKAYGWELLLGVVLGIMVPGCGVFTTYQAARALPPGNAAAGLECGFGSALALGGFPVMVDLGPTARVGIVDGIDVGVRPLLLYADVKYQFLKGHQDGAIDLGVSYWPTTHVILPPDEHTRLQDFGLYPMVLFSTDHFFYGARVAYIRQVEEGTVTNRLMPGAVVGLSVGDRLRFLPSIGLYFCAPSITDDNPPFAFGLGFGLEYETGRREREWR